MLIDISRPIHAGMAIYPNNPDVSLDVIQEAGTGKSGLTKISFGSHTGTHIDTPLHIKPNTNGAEQYDLDIFVGDAEVVEVSADTVITVADLPMTTSSRVLFKTVNSQKDIDEFSPDFVALDESAAQELIHRGVKLIGIDALSIKKKGVQDKVHQLFLDAGVVIVEGLWLAYAAPGHYELMCLPLPIAHIDGVPARAALAPSKQPH